MNVRRGAATRGEKLSAGQDMRHAGGQNASQITHLDKGTAFWENSLGKAGGFLGDWANRFRFE